jgi:hydroxymethylpyrimidine/phosphomethylpyrimidine kinase
VREQIELLLKNFPVGAIKTGLLCNAAIVAVVARALGKMKRPPLVIDPVMIATSGDALLEPAAIAIYERELLPLGTLITPNLDEAARLLGDEICDLNAMRNAAKVLAKKYGTNVLLKGGHLRGSRGVDILSDGREVREFSSAFIANVKTHGTGCTYSAAIAAELARKAELPLAIARAKRFVSFAIRSRFVWRHLGGSVTALSMSSRAFSMPSRTKSRDPANNL